MSPILSVSSSGPTSGFYNRGMEALLARKALLAQRIEDLHERSDFTANPAPSLTLDEMIDFEDGLVAFNEGQTLVDFEYSEDSFAEEDDESNDSEDDEDSEEDGDEELSLDEELADLRELVTLEDFAGVEDSGFEHPISYLNSLEHASILLEEHKRLYRRPLANGLCPAPVDLDARSGPTQYTSNLPFSHPNFIEPTRQARPEYICPHAGCPINSNHRTGKFSFADTDRPFRICFLELNLRHVSLTFDDFMLLHAFYAAHEKPLESQDKGKSAKPRPVYQSPIIESDSQSDEQFEAEGQDEEDACAGAQEVKVKAPSREIKIAKATSSIDRLIDARIEKMLADRAAQANGDRSKVLLDLLRGPVPKA